MLMVTARVEPERLSGAPIHFDLDDANEILDLFDLPRPAYAEDFPDKGNIHNDTFLVLAGPRGEQNEYLLQRINHQVFTRPRRVMAAMMASIEAQNRALESAQDSAEWHTIRLMPTADGEPYLVHGEGEDTTFWRLMHRIPECRTFKSLSEVAEGERLKLAEEAGRGLALYIRFTESMDISYLDSPLPGYRDTRLYYDQLHSVLNGSRTLVDAAFYLPADRAVRHSTERHFLVHLPDAEYYGRINDPDLQPFIELARNESDFAMTLLREMEAGVIRTVAIHGDTKLDNFLFCDKTGRAKALIDLDTIMPHSWLADWGDMVRSLVNVAGEKERDLSRVDVDLEVFEAVARGFLGCAGDLPASEVELMVDSVQIIALELGVRFLADYLRGDSYFSLGPTDDGDLNKVRAMVQFTLFQQLRKHAPDIRCRIAALSRL